MGNTFRRQVKIRTFAVAGVLAIAAVAVVARLYYLQVVFHQRLSSRADSQIYEKVHVIPKRGDITDRRGRKLAVDVEVDSIFGMPAQVEDIDRTARELSRVVGAPEKHFRRELKRGKSFVWLQRQVSPSTVSSIKELKLSGIGFIKENRRYYPQRELAAQVVGLAGIDNQGLEGAELYYDKHLLREEAVLLVERDANGRDLFVAGSSAEKYGEKGQVRLTLDETVQFIVQEELARGVREAGARGGSAVAIDPRTGELLAMANLPFFNPNSFQRYGPSYFRNRNVSDLVEPGSILKPLLLAAALEEEAVEMNTLFFCENGTMSFYGRTLHDVHPHAYLDAKGVIVESSNIGATKMAQKLGAEQYYRYLRNFGFGEKTGIDLPGEAAGLLRPVADWSGLSISAIAMGQEISVTPLQMAVAFSAAVNGGRLFSPTVTREIVAPGGETVKGFSPVVVRRVVSQETSRRVVEALKKVVSHGTGKPAAVEGYTVGGKTGTAQKYDRGKGTYSSEKYLASFVGFAPADDPRIVLVVMIDEPGEEIWGGSVAAPVFRRATRRLMRYLNVPPNEEAKRLFVRS